MGWESPNRRYLQTHGSEQLKKTQCALLVLRIAWKIISDFSSHFGISVLVILAVISFFITISITEFWLSCCVIALLMHYWKGKTTAPRDNSQSTPHIQITALLFYCNSVFSSWCDTELMLMVAFTCPEDRLNEMKMPFMILSKSLCADPVKHLASSFLCFHCCILTWIIMS